MIYNGLGVAGFFFFFPKLRCLVILKYPLAFYRCCPWQALGSHPGTSGHLCTGPSGKMDQVLSFCHFAVFIGTPLPQATPREPLGTFSQLLQELNTTRGQ